MKPRGFDPRAGAASHPNLTFVTFGGMLSTSFRVKSVTSKLMFLVWFSNLKYALSAEAYFKFTAQACAPHAPGRCAR